MSSAPNSPVEGFREGELRGKEILFSGATQMSIRLTWKPSCLYVPVTCQGFSTAITSLEKSHGLRPAELVDPLHLTLPPPALWVSHSSSDLIPFKNSCPLSPQTGNSTGP